MLFLIVILWLQLTLCSWYKKRQILSDFLLFSPANISSGMFSCQADITLCSCNRKWSYITVFRHSLWEDRKEGQCIAFPFIVIENPRSGYHPGWSLRRGKNSQEKIWDLFVSPSFGNLTFSVYGKGQTHARTCTHTHTHTHTHNFLLQKKKKTAML